MKEKVEAKWLDNMAFEGLVNGHKIVLDATEQVGGNDKGARPKPLMLLALAGCTGMDVVSILKKMRLEFTDLKISVEGELSEEHPKHFIGMNVIYEFWGNDLPLEKLQKAVSLSEERYCGVNAVYKKTMPITSEIIIHNE